MPLAHQTSVDDIPGQPRHNGGMSGNTPAPTAAALIDDLGKLRRIGLPGARHTRFPALEAVAEAVAAESALPTLAKIESLLTSAISALDTGEYGDAALALFGLAEGLRARSPAVRREKAATQLEITADSFQRRYEHNLLADISNKILLLLTNQHLRDARLELERRRHPADSRLAVQWVERFEAYHKLWTPAWALGADLTAHRSTLLDPARPYDQTPGTDGPDDPGYTQEEQADGYAIYALYRWAWFQWGVRQFMLKHGGMWLLSSTEAETRAADLVYEIGWHVTVYNERDHSWLRNAISQSRGQELDDFRSLLEGTSRGAARLEEWRSWCTECACTWNVTNVSDGRFPTSATEAGVTDGCQLHKVVAACDKYCSLIEAEWLKIADWYHLGSRYDTGIRPSDLFRNLARSRS